MSKADRDRSLSVRDAKNHGDYDAMGSLPPGIREIRSNYSQKLIEAKRKTRDNFLSCGDIGYVRGGVPIFFANSHGHKRVWEIDVASIGVPVANLLTGG
jgi:hypothetical protein